MYTHQQKVIALKKYEETNSVTATVQALGYPGRETLYRWLNPMDSLRKQKSTFRGLNTPDHPRHPPVNLKLEAIHRCFELGEDVKSIADEIGYSRASIYTWRRRYIQKGTIALMNPEDDPRGELSEGIASSSEALDGLKAQIQDMQVEIDVLKATIDVLKKDPGVDWATLKNREKAVIIDALKQKDSLPKLLSALHCSRSSYYYQQKLMRHADKYGLLREQIKDVFEENDGRYGYRRIHCILQRNGVRVSEKVIRRLMKCDGLVVPLTRRRKYCSYKGEITPAVPNILKRNFHAARPNQKWLTDITEFAIPAGKVYLSPMIDCFDGLPVCWKISVAPNANLVNEMLDAAISGLQNGEHPIIHSDRGCHYRWPGWISKMQQAHLVRSMSSKGCSPDNSACEGFFGRMKNEMFYGRSWVGVTLETFMHLVNTYMVWYRNQRIKVSLGGMTILEYRKSLGLSA